MDEAPVTKPDDYRGFSMAVCRPRKGWWNGWATLDRPGDGEGKVDRTAFFVEEVSKTSVLVLLRERIDAWHLGGPADLAPSA